MSADDAARAAFTAWWTVQPYYDTRAQAALAGFLAGRAAGASAERELALEVEVECPPCGWRGALADASVFDSASGEFYGCARSCDAGLRLYLAPPAGVATATEEEV